MTGTIRKILCALHMCPCRPASDDTGCWGECIHCGRRYGFVDRATLRRFVDAEYAARSVAKEPTP
jgi:hypothetical protein